MKIETQFGVVSAEITGDGEDLFLLAPGAGSNYQSAGIMGLAKLLDRFGRVLRFNFPYRENGRSFPDPMSKLVPFFREVADFAKSNESPRRLFIGGHSMGGRAASMLAAEHYAADGLILFSYPLHPPAKPDQLRTAHLDQIQLPVLTFSGTEDEFCTLDVLAKFAGPNWKLVAIEGGDHSLKVKKASGRSNKDVSAELATNLENWLASL